MSVFTKICTGLLISSLSLAVHAAQTEPQTPIQEPAEPSIDFSSPTEVIQLLHVGVASESRIIELVLQRSPDEAMQQFVDQLSQDVSEFNSRLEELASSKSVSLSPEQLTENVQMIETQMTEEVQALTDKTDEEFRAAVIDALISKYEKALEIYTRVEQDSTDEELKAAVAAIRPMTEKHLEDVQKLKAPATEPTQPTEPAQPTE